MLKDLSRPRTPKQPAIPTSMEEDCFNASFSTGIKGQDWTNPIPHQAILARKGSQIINRDLIRLPKESSFIEFYPPFIDIIHWFIEYSFVAIEHWLSILEIYFPNENNPEPQRLKYYWFLLTIELNTVHTNIPHRDMPRYSFAWNSITVIEFISFFLE